jgi:hypothetical protein
MNRSCHGRTRAVLVGAVASLCAAAAGCGDAAEKCRNARESAALAWTEYVAALEHARGLAQATQVEANDKLSGDVELRLSPVAQRQADARYDRSSEAWSRAHTIALNDACARDAECSALKRRNAEAKNAVADLDERLPPARAAQDAARGPAAEAARTSAAVLVHPEYPQLAKAKQLGAAAAELCADVPAAASPSAQ